MATSSLPSVLAGTSITEPLAGINFARWQLRTCDERIAASISQKHGLPEILARILVARGVDEDGLESALSPTLKALLPDPAMLTDMNKAAERLASAMMAGETIAVFGDYDVDGGTSAALLVHYARALLTASQARLVGWYSEVDQQQLGGGGGQQQAGQAPVGAEGAIDAAQSMLMRVMDRQFQKRLGVSLDEVMQAVRTRGTGGPRVDATP